MVEFPLVLVGPLLVHVMRGVSGARREIDEEWFLRCGCLLLADPTDRLLGDGFGEMPLRIVVRRLDGRGIFEERRMPLVRLPTLEAVEIIEAFACWPAIVGAAGAKFVVGRVVPLAEGGG